MGKRGRPPYPDILTPREFEVLELLRDGLSNPEIAERLGISRDGAKYHVSENLSKLGLESRDEAARWQPAEARPWWAAAFAPLLPAWKKLSGAFQGAAGVAARAVAIGVLAVAAGGLALVGVLLWLQDGDGGDAVVSYGASQLSYIAADGALWLVDADESGRRKLADDGVCGLFSNFEWSPTGEHVSCVGSDSGEEFAPGRIVVRDVEGSVVSRIEGQGLVDFYWSPAGYRLAYVARRRIPCGPACDGAGDGISIYAATGEDAGSLDAKAGSTASAAWAAWGWPLWSPDGSNIVYKAPFLDETRVFDLVTGKETTLQEQAMPLGWALGRDALIVAENYEPPPEPGPAFPSYEVKVVNLSNGAETRIPELDNGVQFWISPDGERAVYVTRSQRSDGLPGLGVTSLLTGNAAPIQGSLITYGSEHIPKEWVTFSRDGKYVYWVGGDNAGYRARIDGTGLERLLTLDAAGFSWSPDLQMILYVQHRDNGPDQSQTLYVVQADGTGRRLIASRQTSGIATMPPFAAAWRPGP